MIVNAMALVLSRRDLGEHDRLCSLYTETLGKMPVRFVGVNRPRGKLKALSEPGVWGEYRLHLSPRSEFAKALGGRLLASFPGWRQDLARTFDALACCEMLEQLTPERAPSPEKYRLLMAVLMALEASPSAWLLPAFGLRLCEAAGVGLRERAPAAARGCWTLLHEGEPAALALRPVDHGAAEAARRLLDEHMAGQLGRRLRGFEFRDAWAASQRAEEAVA